MTVSDGNRKKGEKNKKYLNTDPVKEYPLFGKISFTQSAQYREVHLILTYVPHVLPSPVKPISQVHV